MSDQFQYAPAIVLNKHKRYEDGRIVPINIYGSSANQGTSIYVKPIHSLFDVGVDFEKLIPIKNEIDVIMISHGHSDHLNWHTLQSLTQGRPDLTILLPDKIQVPLEFQSLLPHIIWMINHKTIQMTLRNGTNLQIEPVKVPHGHKTTMSYVITFMTANLLFSTDLSSTKPLPHNLKFDLILLEMNYDADAFVNTEGSGGAVNHLSVQEGMNYATTHLNEYGHIIPLHFGPTLTNFNQLH